MNKFALVLMAATTLTLITPAGAQTYLYGMPSGGAGTAARGGYGNFDDGRATNNNRRNAEDWRERRDNWRDRGNDWRINRNDWRDAEDPRPRYPVGEDEAKARAKARAYDDKAKVQTKDDDYSADCNGANSWRGSSSSATCR